ncbi:MAG: TIGR00730 family Rossman fold protein [Acidovorax sp.]|uniref:LOG family protein n=1 Tax=Acidovorax sp. TaxID=1872122 RepID=UPI0039E5B849
MTRPAFSVCVYCGSRPGEDPAFADAARAVGRWIGVHGGQLVYGGGRSGLMGLVAEATREAGGRVVGVIPQALVDRELANRQCDELHIVQTMHERKALMAERSDAFLALPGGIGTFEELFEVWTWRQLGYHDKPLGLLNVAGYYDGLLSFLQGSVASGFLGEWQMELLRAGSDAAALLTALVQDAGANAETSALRKVI